MGRPARLSRDAICDAAMELLGQSGAADFTLRSLGRELGVDATAVYRHFEDKDDLLIEVGDRSMAPVTRGFRTTDNAVADIKRLCKRLRATLIENPVVLPIVAAGPTRRNNELRITEILLDALGRGRLRERVKAGIEGRGRGRKFRPSQGREDQRQTGGERGEAQSRQG